jgi:hypothetical protein|tara:strand:- start:596 stop:1147 length:552 start_codon:yes stop_codon:yes gene_type:complete
MYGIKSEYYITPNISGSEFLENEVQKYCEYKPKSEREKYADVWMDPFTALNVKTMKLNAQAFGGRICTAAVNEWLRDKRNNLKLFFIKYQINNGHLIVVSKNEYYLEEIEYTIMNQGKGLLMAKMKGSKLALRPKVSREFWLNEFEMKYNKFAISQIDRFKLHINKWCNNVGVVNNGSLENFI